MKYIEVPDSRVREGASGDLWLDVGDGNWAPVLPPARRVELRDVMADPFKELIVPRQALAVVLNYAHHVAVSNADLGLLQALLELDQRMLT